jgi:hypothetical protein
VSRWCCFYFRTYQVLSLNLSFCPAGFILRCIFLILFLSRAVCMYAYYKTYVIYIFFSPSAETRICGVIIYLYTIYMWLYILTVKPSQAIRFLRACFIRRILVSSMQVVELQLRGASHSASEGRLQLDKGFLKNEAIHCYETQKQLSNRANENRSYELLRGYPHLRLNVQTHRTRFDNATCGFSIFTER